MLPQYTSNEHWSYSNTNYVLLAKIIEKVSGLSYETYLQQYIAEPLNLTHMTTQPIKQFVAQGQTFNYEEQQYKKVLDDPFYTKSKNIIINMVMVVFMQQSQR